ncbi:MAG: DUF4833 domain-containing protein [Bacteroidetes bacterium]|nr:DUF4833 domain-containing protein [Bacteroidota bacterium]
MKKSISYIILLLFFTIGSSFTLIDKLVINEYPSPEGISNLLFYVQRTINSNTIVYTLNTNKDGELNENEPIKAYWIKYTQNGKIDPLTYIQRNYAYGVKSKLIDKDKKSFQFEFVSYNKRKFFLMKSGSDNQYHAFGYVNNKMTILNNIMVRIEGGTFWVPNVKSVEVIAKDPSTSKIITEIIKP